jgi:hypothetical protein
MTAVEDTFWKALASSIGKDEKNEIANATTDDHACLRIIVERGTSFLARE